MRNHLLLIKSLTLVLLVVSLVSMGVADGSTDNWPDSCDSSEAKILDEDTASGVIKSPGDQDAVSFRLDEGDTLVYKLSFEDNGFTYAVKENGIETNELINYKKGDFPGVSEKKGAVILKVEAEENGVLCYKLKPIQETIGLDKIREENLPAYWKVRVAKNNEPAWLWENKEEEELNISKAEDIANRDENNGNSPASFLSPIVDFLTFGFF